MTAFALVNSDVESITLYGTRTGRYIDENDVVLCFHLDGSVNPDEEKIADFLRG